MKRIIFVTGATSGIGEECSRYLVENDYSVVIVGQNEHKLQKLKEEFQDNCILSIRANLLDPVSVEKIFFEIDSNNIRLDGFVHCAGVDSSMMPTRMIKNENVEKLFRLHTGAFIQMCRLFYKKNISSDGSSIVAISSLASIMCQQNSLDYSVSKAALNASVKVISKEFIKRGIRVNAILPANVDTPMCDNLKKMGCIGDIQPMGFIEPIYIAYMVEYLLSEKSKYITGGLIPISAGMEY